MQDARSREREARRLYKLSTQRRTAQGVVSYIRPTRFDRAAWEIRVEGYTVILVEANNRLSYGGERPA